MTFSPELGIRHVLRANCFFVCRFKKQVMEFRSPVAVLEWEDYSTWILCRPLEVGYSSFSLSPFPCLHMAKGISGFMV
jgi:hypothetical protein